VITLKPEPEPKGPPFDRLVAAVQGKLDPGRRSSGTRVPRRQAGGRAGFDAALRGKSGSTDILVARRGERTTRS
jgi:hypothetical protein